MRKVIFLFGVNGSGKSTLARGLTDQVPDVRLVGSSDVLRHAFDGMSRDQLERADPLEKRLRLRTVLLRTFATAPHGSFVVCDMHLAVPIRDGHGLRYEYMWDEAYEPYVHRLCYVQAPPAIIAERHRIDSLNGTRVRRLTSDDIEASAQANLKEFKRLFTDHPDAHVIENVGAVSDVAAQLCGLM